MQKIATADHSFTYYSGVYKQTYHSVSGAIEESYKKFLEPSGLMQKAAPRLLDIGFGLGYRSLVALHEAKKSGKSLAICALEKDIGVLKVVADVPVGLHESYNLLRFLVDSAIANTEAVSNGFSLNLLVGDAMHTVRQLEGLFDAVFLDPFSPRVNPELWTAEFLSCVRKLMKPDAMLATYSCAKVVRENLRSAGFIVQDGPCVGRRGPSTVAFPEK